MATPTAESGTHKPYSKAAGSEPLPGYTLIQPLGRGGFGEVWECVAPGGLHKAIKFVASDPNVAEGGEQLRQEFDAFQQIKLIRHPFLLSLERVELIGNELVMVMELADRQLQDRFRECNNARLPGIPRDELLAYLADAAEALDIISAKYNLQHLDVKPANLFLISGHVKVGDYGLVSSLDGSNTSRGLTPRYVAPEVLRGQVHTRSDQYSLALVYHELLTGKFPYSAQNSQQMMLQHVTVPPDLSALPLGDQPIVAKALAKKPEERHGSCMAFIRALMVAINPDLAARQARLDRSQADLFLPPDEVMPAGSPRGSHPGSSTVTGSPHLTTPRPVDPPVEEHTVRSVPPLTVTNRNQGKPALPPLVSAGSRSLQRPQPRPISIEETPPPQQQATVGVPRDEVPLDEDLPEAAVLRIDPIRSIVPITALIGQPAGKSRLVSAGDFVQAVLKTATGGHHIPKMPGDIGQMADGTWISQFPSTVATQVIPHKMTMLRDKWGVILEEMEPTHLILRKSATGSMWASIAGKKKRSGMEVILQYPQEDRAGEVTVYGRLFGTPGLVFEREAADVLPKILADIRRELQNVEDRREAPRIPATLPLTIYPIHTDGSVEEQIVGLSKDVSDGGLCFVTAKALPTKYMYIAFDGIAGTAGQAILTRLMRRETQVGRDHITAVRYRTDL